MQCFSVTLVPELVLFQFYFSICLEVRNSSLCPVVPYLIFVIFGTPPYFLDLKKYATKVRKFATKIASQQNSVNQYFGIQIHILGVLFGVLGF